MAKRMRQALTPRSAKGSNHSVALTPMAPDIDSRLTA